jgi:hypothetical protein
LPRLTLRSGRVLASTITLYESFYGATIPVAWREMWHATSLRIIFLASVHCAPMKLIYFNIAGAGVDVDQNTAVTDLALNVILGH